jgi:hypothetical protein
MQIDRTTMTPAERETWELVLKLRQLGETEPELSAALRGLIKRLAKGGAR